MERRSEQTFKEYFAGASLAFGTIVITLQIIGTYYGYSGVDPQASIPQPLINIIMAVHALAGALGGYLVARRSEENALRAGGVTSILAYVIVSIYNLIFGQVIGNIWVLVNLVVGGVIGALFAQAQRKRGRLGADIPEEGV